MLETIISYDNASNFVFDSNLIEIDTDHAQLLLVGNAGNTFDEDFADDTDFVYDNAKAEFVGGVARSKMLTMANEQLLVSPVTTADASRSIADGTATAQNGATITEYNSKNYLDISGGVVGRCFQYNPSNCDFGSVGTISFKVVPQYTGAPASNQYFFTVSGDANAHRLSLWHQSDGNIWLVIKRGDGGTRSQPNMGAFSPVAGTEYDIEIVFGLDGTGTKLYVDGIEIGTSASAENRVSPMTEFSIGNIVGQADFLIRDFQVFTDKQHTANFDGDLPRTINLYEESMMQLPAMNYSGIGEILSYESLTCTEVGTPRYIFNGEYWNGAAWAASDDSYAQANTLVDINAHLGSKTPSDNNTIKVVFPSGLILSSVDDLSLEYTDEGYSKANPTIETGSTVDADELQNFLATTVVVGSDSVTFYLVVNGVATWFNGAAWVASDKSLAQSNTAADILANMASLDITAGATLTVGAILHSDDGSTTPELYSHTLGYSYWLQDPTEPNEAYLHGHFKDILGDNEDNPVTLIIENKEPIQHGGYIIRPTKVEIESDSEGRFEFPLVETETISKKYLFKFKYTNIDGVEKTATLGEATIPNQPIVNLSDLTFS